MHRLRSRLQLNRLLLNRHRLRLTLLLLLRRRRRRADGRLSGPRRLDHRGDRSGAGGGRGARPRDGHEPVDHARRRGREPRHELRLRRGLDHGRLLRDELGLRLLLVLHGLVLVRRGLRRGGRAGAGAGLEDGYQVEQRQDQEEESGGTRYFSEARICVGGSLRAKGREEGGGEQVGVLQGGAGVERV